MIKITDKYYVSADPHCYILQEKSIIQDKKSKKCGQETFKTLGYYSTLESCFRGVLKTETRRFMGKQEENTIKELLEVIDNLDKFLKERLKEV